MKPETAPSYGLHQRARVPGPGTARLAGVWLIFGARGVWLIFGFAKMCQTPL